MKSLCFLAVFLISGLISGLIPGRSAFGKTAFTIRYRFTLDDLKLIQSTLERISSLPEDSQHDAISDPATGFSAFAWCLPKDGKPNCTLTFDEEPQKADDGKFILDIRAAVDVKHVASLVPLFQEGLEKLHGTFLIPSLLMDKDPTTNSTIVCVETICHLHISEAVK